MRPRTSDGIVRSGTVEVRRIPVEVAEWGGDKSAPPIVLLHEGLGSVGLWRDFPTRLEQHTGRRVFAFSRFGHGRSGRPPKPRTPRFFHEEALEALPELLRRHDIREPVLLGHSDGASIAVIHAAHYPVSALVLLAPHVFVETVTVDAIRETRRAYVDGTLRERLARHHDDPDAAFWGWCDVWLDPSFADWDLQEEASQVRAPTLLVQGAEDPYGTLEQIERIERAGSDVERLILPGGHSPHLEHPDLVAAQVAAFLSRVTPPVLERGV